MASTDDDDQDDSDQEEAGPSRNKNGQPHGIPLRSRRQECFNLPLSDDEIWQWKTRPGAELHNMNGTAIETLKRFVALDRTIVDSREAQLARDEILARGKGASQVTTRFTPEEIDWWRKLAKRYGMKPGPFLIWAFAVCDLADKVERL